MTEWNSLASEESIRKVESALEANGVAVYKVKTSEEAKEKLFELLPLGAEVMNMTSVTLDTIGVAKEIVESGRYNSVRAKLMIMDRAKQGGEMQKLGAAPDWVVGSVHAITEEGQILVASNTGSQLPAYAYGASHVIWVAGTQKIVANIDFGIRRIYEHCLPMESERAKKAYGVPASAVNKILILNKEGTPGRIHLILVNEVLGF